MNAVAHAHFVCVCIERYITLSIVFAYRRIFPFPAFVLYRNTRDEHTQVIMAAATQVLRSVIYFRNEETELKQEVSVCLN